MIIIKLSVLYIKKAFILLFLYYNFITLLNINTLC
jgi:hypothetical protein